MHCKFSKVNICTISSNITYNTRKHRKEGNFTQEKNLNDITNCNVSKMESEIQALT